LTVLVLTTRLSYIKALFAILSVILEHRMAVSSGLSLASERNVGRSAWAPSLPLIAGFVVFLALANFNGLPLLADPDSHWHITVGHWILQQRAVPYTDTYSYTFAGQPWIAKEWLSQVAMALAYDVGGWAAVVALCAAAFAATSALLMRILMRDIRPLPALLFTAAAFTMMASHFLARPFALAFPFMLIWVAGLVRAVEERRAPDWRLLAAMLLWANLHGGFTLGLMLTGVFALEALIGGRDFAERKLIFLDWLKFGVAALAVSCVTPYGPQSILVTFQIFGLGDALSLIQEWKSPDFQTQPLMEVILLIALYLILARGVKLPLMRVLVVVGLTHMLLRPRPQRRAAGHPGADRDRAGAGAAVADAAQGCRGQIPVRRLRAAGGLQCAGRRAAARAGLHRGPGALGRHPAARGDAARRGARVRAREGPHPGARAEPLRLRRLPDQRRRADLHRWPRRTLWRRVHQEVRRGRASEGRRAADAREDAGALRHRLDPAAQGPAGEQAARPPSRAGARPMSTTRR
jgi:hypothetical protein